MPSWFSLALILALTVCLSFILNFAALNKNPAPSGADYGNYLTQVNILRGNDLRGFGLRHNPVFFVLLDLFLRFFEEFTALKIAASFVFSLIVIPFFLFAKKLCNNNLAAFISTWIFVFFFSNSEMIAWGGNPNFLAFSFVLLGLYFLIELLKNPSSKKNLILSGLFFSLVIGTHMLAAIFTVFSLLIFMVLSLRWGERSKEKIKRIFFVGLIALAFSLPYLPFYINFFGNSSNGMLGFNLLLLQITPIAIDNIGLVVTALLLANFLGLGLFALSGTFKKEKNKGLILCSIFLSLLILILITKQPERWIYFIPIPLILCFCMYLRNLFSDLDKSRKNIFLCAICFILIISILSTILAIIRLKDATTFYTFIEDDEVKALDWIKENTTPSATIATSGHPRNIGGGGNSYAWWIEGYSERICLFSGDPDFFSYQFERDEVRLLNRIFRGTYSIEYGHIGVIDNFPAGTSNPEIGIISDGEYEGLLTLNDEQHQLFSSLNESDVSPFYAENKTSVVSYSETWTNVTTIYENSKYEMMRSLIMGEGKSSIDIIFKVSTKDSALGYIKIVFWGLFDTSLEDCRVDQDYIVTLSPSVSDQNKTAQIKVLETNSEFLFANVLLSAPKNSKPVVTYELGPREDELFVHFRVIIGNPNSEINKPTIELYDSNSLIEDLGIDYIFLNRARVDEYDRFRFDDEHFAVVNETEHEQIAIFKVL